MAFKLPRHLLTQRTLAHNIKQIDLLACKQLKISFDPFASQARSIRDFLYEVSRPKLRSTNYDCGIKVDVKSDRSAPEMFVKFGNGNQALFKTENLSTLDIVKEFNTLCKQHAPNK